MIRARSCLPLFMACVLGTTTDTSAQSYYGSPIGVTVVTPLPAANYVVYSPSFLGWRSAGYYGGNWGPYYYNPPAMYPYTPGNAIWPNRLPAYPPYTPPLRR